MLADDSIEVIYVVTPSGTHLDIRTPAPAWPQSAGEDMLSVLRHGTSPHVPGAEGLRSVQLMEAVSGPLA
jgi:hypothetical protein